MRTIRTVTGFSINCVAAVVLCSPVNAWAQEKQKVSYKVAAENAKYTQRNTIDVGDELWVRSNVCCGSRYDRRLPAQKRTSSVAY